MNKSQGLSPKKIIGISVGVLKCNQCGLIYSSPQPVPSNLEDHYGVPAESYWKKEYFKWSPNYFKYQIENAKKLINTSFSEKPKALDIGAGIGKAMLSLNYHGFEAYGLEPSDSFYLKAINEMGIKKNKLKPGKVEEIDYPENTFDFITFGAVLEHLYSPRENINKSLKWLKTGGIIHIEVPSSNWLISKLLNIYYRLRGTNYVTNLSPMSTPFHLYEFDLKSFKILGESLNFSVEKHYYTVCEVMFIPKILKPFFFWFMDKTNKGMQLTVYLKKLN